MATLTSHVREGRGFQASNLPPLEPGGGPYSDWIGMRLSILDSGVDGTDALGRRFGVSQREAGEAKGPEADSGKLVCCAGAAVSHFLALE